MSDPAKIKCDKASSHLSINLTFSSCGNTNANILHQLHVAYAISCILMSNKKNMQSNDDNYHINWVLTSATDCFLMSNDKYAT